MKKSIFLGASLALMGLAITPAIAQTQSTTTSTTTSYIQSTAVVGARIKDSRGEEIGVIKDFVLDRNTGCLAYVVISTGKGGVLTASKTVAAPWAVFSVSADPKVYVTRIEREKIYSAPVWESTRIEEYNRTDYLNNVYSYYGVPAPRFNAEMSVGLTNTTTTGTTSTTNATAAPSMTAASTAGAPPTPAATAAASPLGTPERSAAPPSSPAGASSPKAPAHTHAHSPAKETSDPSSTKTESVHEKKPNDEPEKKSEKASTKKESTSEKNESAGESPSQPSKKKQHSSEHGSEPEAASTPKEP
jgi:sporulation protein YlmC with PRC-barrel domain